ncbi:MAG: hypothetical protein ACOC1Z_00585 [Cyanobacteriota bacterium]
MLPSSDRDGRITEALEVFTALNQKKVKFRFKITRDRAPCLSILVENNIVFRAVFNGTDYISFGISKGGTIGGFCV